MVPGTDARAVLGAIAGRAIPECQRCRHWSRHGWTRPNPGARRVVGANAGSAVPTRRAGGVRVPELFGNATLQRVFGMAEAWSTTPRRRLPTHRLHTGPPDPPRRRDRHRRRRRCPGAAGTRAACRHAAIHDPQLLAGRLAAVIHRRWVLLPVTAWCATTPGYITVVGRDKDQINRAGKIAPTEVEDLLLTHAAVRDASVVGAPDDQLGERIVAYVIPSTAAVDSGEGARRVHAARLPAEAGLARFRFPTTFSSSTGSRRRSARSTRRTSASVSIVPRHRRLSPAASDDPLDSEAPYRRPRRQARRSTRRI